MKRSAVVAGLVVFLVLAGTGVGVASWSESHSVSSTVTAGTFEAGLDGFTGWDAVHTGTSAPHIAPLTMSVTGVGPVAVSLSAGSDNDALTTAIRLRTWMPAGANCPGTVPETGVTTSTLAEPVLPPPARSVEAPATLVICAATDVPSGAGTYAGQQTAVSLTLSASLTGTSWTASATGDFQQSVESGAPRFVCVDNVGNVTISWNNTATATVATTYRSLVAGAYPPGWPDRDWYYHEYSNQGWTGSGLPAVAGVYPWVIEETTNGSTSVAYAGEVEVYWYAAWNAWGLRCVG
jgi:hypothetical protein